MHSRILHLSTDRDELPIDAQAIRDLDFVVGQIDYVVQSNSVQEDIYDFVNNNFDTQIMYTDNSLVFPGGYRETYFRHKLDLVKADAKLLDLETYMTYIPVELQHADSNTCGYKVYSESEGIVDYDDFVRFSLEEGAVYQVLNSIDYHY